VVHTLNQIYGISPWAQITVSLGAVLGLIVGWGFAGRTSWVQTIAVPAHWIYALYAVVGAMVALSLGDQGAGTLLFCAAALVNGGLAVFVDSVSSREALSWSPLRTAPAIPQRCEFCGTPLDPETQQCPQCTAVPEIVHRHVAMAPPPAKLTGLMDNTEHEIQPAEKTVIGRGITSNDINLSNPTVSRHHAQIEYKGGYYVLTALKDSNGTFVNDTLVRQRTLQNGDEVRFGRARFRFTIMGSER
jgi:hypothetical protein